MRIIDIILGAGRTSWRTYAAIVVFGVPLILGSVAGFLVATDGNKVLPWSIKSQPPIPDEVQRFFFPMLVRTRSFDSYIFGSSTAMLIDPKIISDNLGGRFSNLAMQDGAAWEQLELLKFVRRETPQLRSLMFTFDSVWCFPEFSKTALQINRFPTWMYDPPSWMNLLWLFNRSAIERGRDVIRGRTKRPVWRIRNDDGYFYFLLPDADYDPQKAKKELYGNTSPEAARRNRELAPHVTISEDTRASWTFPALDQLERQLAGLPASVNVYIIGMPVHVSGQPLPGSVNAARELACKQRANAIALKHATAFIDFRIASPVTNIDDNYWDPLHYRTHVARKLETGIIAAVKTRQSDPDGFWQVFRE